MRHAPLLVVGAGPYGLSTAAYARKRGLEPLVVGEPMGFWKNNMPPGMLLRSGLDWHLDAAGELTLEAYVDELGIAPSDVDPIPLALYLDCVALERGAARGRPRAARDRVPVDVSRVSYLAASGLVDELELVDSVPLLDEAFGASVPGLFFAGFVATRDFGPFFGFTRGCPVAARIIVGRLAGEQPDARHTGPRRGPPRTRNGHAERVA